MANFKLWKGDILQKYKIISREYYPNCMIEALKAKINNPKVKLYFCKPRITENSNFQMFHFMWSDSKADYDFSDLKDREMLWYKDFIFKGVLRKFPPGFAEKYSRYRNKKQKGDICYEKTGKKKCF